MNLVHRDINVKVVRVVVNDAHTLMLRETEHSTELLLAIEQDISARAFPLAKREKKVVCLVVVRPLVESLNGYDFERSNRGIIRVTVGDSDTPDALLRVLRIEQVANEPDVTAAAALRASRTPTNHCTRSCTSTGDRRSSCITYVQALSRLVAQPTSHCF